MEPVKRLNVMQFIGQNRQDYYNTFKPKIVALFTYP
jgi:hypothetical protein